MQRLTVSVRSIGVVPVLDLCAADHSIPRMPRRELSEPSQVESWLREWGRAVKSPCSLILIGSAGLLWHAHRKGVQEPLPENSMDADPVTEDEEVALLAYDAMIGSEFELTHGWHVNLMPKSVLRELPTGWENRASEKTYALSARDGTGSRGFACAQAQAGRASRSCARRVGLPFRNCFAAERNSNTSRRMTSRAWSTGECCGKIGVPASRLVAHWQDERHPYRARFARAKDVIVALLSAPVAEFPKIVGRPQHKSASGIREIPPVFGHFWADSFGADSLVRFGPGSSCNSILGEHTRRG